jgi:hypothetical protein
MPDARLRKTHDAYIVTGRSGAQFVFDDESVARKALDAMNKWRAPHENDAEQLQRRSAWRNASPLSCGAGQTGLTKTTIGWSVPKSDEDGDETT